MVSTTNPADVTQLIPVNPSGRRLAVTRSGAGAPTVVLETGLGAESSAWAPVQRAIQPLATVIRYDRANRGASDPAPKPRSAQDCVSDLHTLLTAASAPRPLVLVGHSLGGLIVRLYAYRHPGEVAGLVLVDPMHGDQFTRIGALLPPPFPGEPARLTEFRRFWTEDWRDPVRNAEGIDFVACQTQAEMITSLGSWPVILLTAGEFVRQAPGPVGARLQQGWQEMAAEILQLSSAAEQITVETSGHFIQREQPAVVVGAIRQMLERVGYDKSGH